MVVHANAALGHAHRHEPPVSLWRLLGREQELDMWREWFAPEPGKERDSVLRAWLKKPFATLRERLDALQLPKDVTTLVWQYVVLPQSTMCAYVRTCKDCPHAREGRWPCMWTAAQRYSCTEVECGDGVTTFAYLQILTAKRGVPELVGNQVSDLAPYLGEVLG